MFKRLLKHQLKTTWKEFNIAYGVIIFLGFLLAVAINSNSTPFIIVSSILFVFAIFAILTMLVNNSIKLLYSTTYGKQAYLTFTLPISTHALIFSKIISTLLYFVGYFISIVLSILTFFIFFDLNFILELINVSEELVKIISINPLAGLIALVYSFISFLAGLIQLQCVFAFAHSFPSAKKKTSLIILSLFVVGTAIAIIESFPPVDIYLGVGSENVYSIMFYIGSEIDLSTFIPIMSIWSLIIRLAQIFGFYFLTIYLIDKKIEIQ